MLTVDFGRMPISAGERLLDLGCGGGRHAFEAARRGARVVAMDTDRAELDRVTATFAAMAEAAERICWQLSDEYHNNRGGHIRIFTRRELVTKLTRSGLTVTGQHHAHSLHSPYWWVKCAVGVRNDDHPLASAFHRLLVWDIMRKPAVTRIADQALNPLIGKSLVVYADKHVAA